MRSAHTLAPEPFSADVAILCDAGCASASGIPPGDTTLLRVSPTSLEKSLLTVGRLPRGGERVRALRSASK